VISARRGPLACAEAGLESGSRAGVMV
jgi:hypothetical protein